MHSGPFPSASFSVANFYHGPFAGSWVLVYAGQSDIGETASEAVGPANGQAGLRIFQESESNDISLVGTFAEPDASGAMTVQSVSGPIVTLADYRGTLFTFDLTTDTFTQGSNGQCGCIPDRCPPPPIDSDPDQIQPPSFRCGISVRQNPSWNAWAARHT